MSSVAAAQHIEAHIVDVELSAAPPAVPRVDARGRVADRAWLIVRVCGEVLGIQRIEIPAAGLATDAVGELLSATWAAELRRRELLLEDLPDGRLATGESPFSLAHAAYLGRADRCSVVICTREKPEGLAAALESLVAQDHPDFHVWVIDSAPRSDATERVVGAFTPRLSVRCLAEPRPGLARARNRALAQDLDGEIVAWLDDDELADPMWLSELCRALAQRPAAVGASGAVVPGELLTPAQMWFEQFGGHSKGRGFTPAEFSPDSRREQSPLYPLPPFGVGANMAFRTDALRRAGGFDPALGAGTRTQAGEDTRMFTELLRRGGTTLYHPSALTRHFHRRELSGLSAQMRGYGVGLTAFYTALLLDSPSVILPLAALAGRAIRDLSSSSSVRVATLEDDFPPQLLRDNRRGMLLGPAAYLRQRLADRVRT
jgi:GT2 family glycosyltransferase